jgi:tetratricopeptide (TPR) repeat protein
MRSPNYDLPHVLEAKDILVDVVEKYPHYPEGWSSLGIVHSVLEEDEEAKECWERALELRPNYAEVYGNIGTDHALNQRWHEALMYYHKALSIRSDIPTIWINVCIAYAHLGDIAKAEDAYQKVKADFPRHAQLWRCPFNLGRRFEAAKLRLESTRLRIELMEQTPSDRTLLLDDKSFFDLW